MDSKWLNSSFEGERFNLSGTKTFKCRFIAIFFSQLINFSTSFVKICEFPYEELCLFKQFPRTQLVFLLLLQSDVWKCSFTIKWLQMYFCPYTPFLTLIDDNQKFINISSRISFNFLFCDLFIILVIIGHKHDLEILSLY